MRLSWKEISTRAGKFAEDWKDAEYEKGETQLFYQDFFFKIFGVPIRRVAIFEKSVTLLNNRRGFIDLFWKGMLLVEQKSAGYNLEKAKAQALNYCLGLSDNEHPRYILVSDFKRFKLFDLEDDEETSFALAELPKHIEKFSFIIGVQKRTFKDQDPVNIYASELMGDLHDSLEDSGYRGHQLECFLVRIVFCLFADDTRIFEPRGIFEEFVENQTNAKGTDLGGWLGQIFQTLDTPIEQRPTNIDDEIGAFPYVNGKLFAEKLALPSFDAQMRSRLIGACRFDWSEISPVIFGSLFQSVMNRKERRKHGAHYTSESNILKVIQPLFLDGLRNEFEELKKRKDTRRRADLERFHKRLGQMKFIDPACGCGNFLIIAYRELRLLEIEIIRELIKYQRNTDGEFIGSLDTSFLSIIDVDQFHGIEINEFPARIAEAAMWMMDHIMNNKLSLEFSEYYARIPLRRSPRIIVGNALDMDWNDVLPSEECTYVLGNPPFIGHQYRTASQKSDMARIWGAQGKFNRLDYVTCWFKKAIEYGVRNKAIETAFVSTNSITQGEQCSILWPYLFSQGVSIHFAHRPFQWNSEARHQAAVHCVVVGMTWKHRENRIIFEYDRTSSAPHASKVSQINGYLIDGPQRVIPARSKTPSGRIGMHKGSQPTDGARLRLPNGRYIKHSNLILDAKERDKLLKDDANASKWLRPYVGGDELISGNWRWCLWLKNADPAEIRRSSAIQERLTRVREGRLQSSTSSVRDFAKYPTLFTQDRQPSESYLAIPEVSSGTREYIPMAILEPDVIASNKLQIIVGAPLYYFGILSSTMHMGWMRVVAGRLGDGYSYAPAVYNSFPWPELTSKQENQITTLAQAVLDARIKFPRLALDVLYDPDAMPPVLRRAHEGLDQAVDRLYRRSGFRFERERVEYLFDLFDRQEAPLDNVNRGKSNRRRKNKRGTAT